MDGRDISSPATGSSATGPALSYRELVAIAVALMATNSLALDTMLPAFPDIASSLHARPHSLPWVVSGFLLGLGGAQIIYGPLSDRFGRRPILMLGLGAYVLFGFLGALAPDFTTLIIFRVLQGASVAATRVVATSLVRDCYSGRQIARIMSVVMMVFLAIPVLAPSIGRVLLLIMPWRGLFMMLALFGSAVLLWAWLRLPETLPPERRRPLSPSSIAGGFTQVLTHRQALGYILATTALAGATYGFINSVQPLFATAFHAPDAMPVAFALVAGMMGLASLVNAQVVERVGTRLVSHGALLLFILIELIHLGIAVTGRESLAIFAIFQGMAMFAFGLVSTNFGAMAMEPLAPVAGTAASAQGFLSMIGGAVIGLIVGQHFDGSAIPVILGFVINGTIALACVLVAERGRLFGLQRGHAQSLTT